MQCPNTAHIEKNNLTKEKGKKETFFDGCGYLHRQKRERPEWQKHRPTQ